MIISVDTFKEVLFDNLCKITGNGSLIKLDMSDDHAMDLRMKLLSKRRYNAQSHNAAVFIYIANVLDQRGYLEGHADRKRYITATSGILTTAWVLHSTGGYSTSWFNDQFAELVSYGYEDTLFPSLSELDQITSDFDRITKALSN